LNDLPLWFPSRDFSMVLLVRHVSKRDVPHV
jgi:hypothetical protein